MKKTIFALALGFSLLGCSEPPVGFFSSEGIRLREDTLNVVKGIYQISQQPFDDGSTRPLNFSIVSVTDLNTGKLSPEFMEAGHTIYAWDSPFNPDNDSTFALVQKKLRQREVTPVEIGSYSGQLVFNGATKFCPDGLYGIDVFVNNEAGEKLIKSYGIIKLKDVPWELPVPPSDAFQTVDEAGEKLSVDIPELGFKTAAYDADAVQQVKDNVHPFRHIEKVGESDIVELEFVCKDANGDCFPGTALVFWPSGDSYLNCYHDNSIGLNEGDERVQVTDTSNIFRFPTTPYPAFGRSYGSGDNLYLCYYELDPKSFTLTPVAKAAADKKNPAAVAYRAAIRNGYKINQTGKWKITCTFPHLVVKK